MMPHSYYRAGSGRPSPDEMVAQGLKAARERREVTASLCRALENFLNFDTDQTIAEMERELALPRFCFDDLMEATGYLQTLEEQRDQNLAAVEGVPQEMRGLVGGMMHMFTGMLDRQIETAKEAVSRIQAALEGLEKVQPDKG